MNHKNLKLGIIGLGYVGLPLAVEFAKVYSVIGYDKDKKRIIELQNGFDRTYELSNKEIKDGKELVLSENIEDLRKCNCYIITVPTPVDNYNQPDLSNLLSASKLVGGILSPGDIVIYESTVYPGATEDDCVPVLVKQSGLSYATSLYPPEEKVFYLGYSPERINPGDKEHRLPDVIKVTSGSTPEIANIIDQLYSRIIKAGTHKASSIRVAEAAKVIENIQRDVNIALINEFAIIFEKFGIDTESVLKAAGTKWNFLPFHPGLVGGHCIGVDPYYLTHKALQSGYTPEIILAGRRINDNMSSYATDRIIKLMLNRNINIIGANILILGVTFKENCPDIRNSKVFDLITSLSDYKCNVYVNDPLVDKETLPVSLAANYISTPLYNNYDAIILAVSHTEFIKIGATKIRKYGKSNHVFFDLKYAFKSSETDERL